MSSYIVHLECNYTPSSWIIQQSGDTIQAWTAMARRSQGIAHKERGPVQMATGRISHGVITLNDGRSRYVLRYDKQSGHLRGTLNGGSFWATPQQMEQPHGCIPVPE